MAARLGSRCRCGWLIAIVVTLGPVAAGAQESKVAADFRRERERVTESCGEVRSIGNCVYTLATDSPLHVALGSLAPQSGFGFGLAFSERYTPNEAWRLTWNADAVATPSGSWRAGAYMKFIHTPETSGVVVAPAGTGSRPTRIAPREFTVFDVSAQSISLESLSYFGAGPHSLESGRARYAEAQTIVGGGVTIPLGSRRVLAPLNPAIVAGVHARFLDVMSRPSNDDPGIAAIYDEQTAPGLTNQDAFVQFHEAFRVRPSLAGGWLRLNYLVGAQQFRTNKDTRSSFNRFITDLQHEIPLMRQVASTGPLDFNGPNDCGPSIATAGCPKPQWSRNRYGTVRLRALLITSTTSGDNRVPFYLQPTLGGSDLNGERRLASFQDYRFRDDNLLALQQSVEFALAGPIGVFLQTEQGSVASRPGALSLDDFSASTTLGVTLRAGGFPLVNLSFSWGAEGHHVIGSMDASLLGGSARPGLY